jgi:ribosomal protein S1
MAPRHLDKFHWAIGGNIMGEAFSGTNFGSGKGASDDFEVEALIKETLEATKTDKKAPEEKKEGFKATSFQSAPKPKVEAKPAAPFPTQGAIHTPAPAPARVIPANKPAAPTAKPAPVAPAKPAAPKAPSDQYDLTFKSYQVGDTVEGTIVKIDPSGALVDIGYQSEALIQPEEGIEGLKIGDRVTVTIEILENRDGFVVVSRERAAEEKRWELAFDAYKNRKVLSAKVLSAVKGGIVVDAEGARGFIPASQIAKENEGNIEALVGKVVPVKVIQVNRRQGKIVMSHRLAAGEQKRFDSEKIFGELEVGQTRHGKVTSIKNFGAFVDVGGIEGLIHLSELSWTRVKHPSEVVKIGDELDVFILGVDKVNRKVALGLKELQPDPWVEATKYFNVGDIVKAKVARLVTFGAFAEIGHNLEGLIHRSEITEKPFKELTEVINPGDEFDVKILRIIPDEQKIGLSIKQVAMDKEKAKQREEMAQQKKIQEDAAKVTIGDQLKAKIQEAEEKAGSDDDEIGCADTDEPVKGVC